MKKTMFLSILTGIMLTACTKQGTIGPQGATGATGQNGVSNMTSYNITIRPGDWSFDNGIYYYNTGITIQTSSACTVEYSTDNTTYIGMPMSSIFTSGDELTYTNSNQYQVQIDYLYGALPQKTIYFNIYNIPQ